MDQILKTFVLKHTKLSADTLSIIALFGQASSRQYFRASCSATKQNFVIMKMPNGFSSPAEEITKIDPSAPKQLPFLNVQSYLSDLGIAVPKVMAIDEENGLILLQDLGDQSFEELIVKADGPFRLMYYKKLIDTLVNMQTQTATHQTKTCIAYHRRFDADLLNWEFWHFLEYAIEDRLKIKVSDNDKQRFKDITACITADIVAMPQGFVHRDFQSRNVMFHEMDFYLIDFQDALVGPVLYDLVALLRDSYINLSPVEVDKLLAHYILKLPEDHPYAKLQDTISQDFFLIALQRKLKDVGRFQYIDTVRGNPNFLKHIPLTFAFIQDILKRLEQMKFSARHTSSEDIRTLHELITTYVNLEHEALKAS